MSSTIQQTLIDLNSVAEVLQKRLHELAEIDRAEPEIEAFNALGALVDSTKAKLQAAA